MTTNKMPTEQEIRAMASNLKLTFAGPSYRSEAAEMLLTIADHLSKSELVATVMRKPNGGCYFRLACRRRCFGLCRR